MYLSYVRVLVDRFAECFWFYRDTMGFEVLWGDEANVYAEFKVSPATKMALCARQVMAEVPGVSVAPAPAADRLMLVFEVEDVDRSVAELQRRGVPLLAGPVDRTAWNVRTAHLRDPDGNLVEINRPLGH
ncbi:MAG: VOC family protein [Acidobacteria bacterium]|nr:VOC family protein [Acidobacteriota bacterium]